MRRKIWNFLAVWMLVSAAHALRGTETNHDFAKWEKEIAAFERMDRTNPPPKNAILFTGASNIRRWKTLVQDFPGYPVLNRGFGGSEIMDATHFADRIIFPCAPRIVFLRAGGNEMWHGKSAEQTFADFREFVAKVHAKLPQTEIVYIGGSPSPARLTQSDKTRTLNTLIQDFIRGKPYVKYLDTCPMVLGTNELPRPELFAADGLHFNAAGFALLAERVRPFLPPPAASPKPPPPLVISRGKAAHRYQAFPDACRLQNGDIIVVFYAGYTHVSIATDEFPLGGRLCFVRSSDEGRTWTPPAALYDDSDDNRDPHISQLDNGTLICSFFSLTQRNRKALASAGESGKEPADPSRKAAGAQIVTSQDNGKTWGTNARVIIPDWYCSAPVRQLPDGTCLLGLYHEDRQTHLSIGGSARSTDRGLTWEAPVPIKAPGISLNAETDIIRLTDGRLYAALRSTKDDMYYAISQDNAKSWSEARKAGFQAHSPHLNRLSTGEIILSHRLPHTSVHISRDDTKTWQGPYEIDSCIGAYPATVELKDHSVLIVYYTEGGGSVIRARRFKLTADGIELLPLP